MLQLSVCLNTFGSAPTSRKVWNTQLVQDDCQFQILVVATFLAIFGVNLYDYLIHFAM